MTVVSRLFGGLGNQLFQYATGRAVALRAGTDHLLDTRDTDARGGHCRYALSHFRVTSQVAGDDALPPGRATPLRYLLWRHFGTSPRFHRERGLGFDDTVLSLRGEVYLHGYFQSEKYFSDVAQTIRKELEFATEPSAENARWLDRIAGSRSVSLHVRRGDYLQAGSDTYAVCSADYYRRAIETVAARLDGDPEVFVFSDDPAWARANMALGYETHFSDHNDASKHYEDMRLISHCRHNITANSTFSWWGAWLNANPDKIVVAPKDWFGSGGATNPDIVPQSWIGL